MAQTKRPLSMSEMQAYYQAYLDANKNCPHVLLSEPFYRPGQFIEEPEVARMIQTIFAVVLQMHLFDLTPDEIDIENSKLILSFIKAADFKRINATYLHLVKDMQSETPADTALAAINANIMVWNEKIYEGDPWFA